MNEEPIIFAIETSCDETSVAIIKGHNKILSNIIVSQIDDHKIFGGVVPEIASRKHIEFLNSICLKALNEASISFEDVDAIAFTYGPGLIGALLIGINYAKGLSLKYKKPLIKVNHLIGHIFANMLSYPNLKPPFLVLLVSGGHTLLIHVKNINDYMIVGNTRDDAVGEAFDKVARILSLGYPGGPAIEKSSKKGFPIYNFPKPMINKGYDFSFSGLKTAVLYFINDNPNAKKEDIASSFQKVVTEILIHKTFKYAANFNIKNIVFAGGVAANSKLREEANKKNENFNIFFPKLDFCTDNAAMIARAGLEKYIINDFSNFQIDANPSLELNEF